MNVLLVSSEPASTAGFGSGKFVAEHSKALREAGIKVAILADSASNETYGLSRVRSKLLRKFMFDYSNPLAYREFDKLSAEFQPDIVHFNNVYGISSGLISHASRSYPTVVTVHDYWPFCYFSTMMKKDTICDMQCRQCAPPLTSISRSLRFSHLSGSVLVGPSLYMKERLEEAGFVGARHIPYGIEIPRKPSLDSPRILFIGRLDSTKGVDGLVKVGVRLGHPLHIIGSGPLASKLRRVSRSHSNVVFHGFLPDVSAVLQEGGIVVIPSIWPDNLPFVALESLAHGLPIVSSRVGGLPELVEHGTNGYLFEPGDLHTLTSLLTELVSNRDLRRRFARASRQKAKDSSWEKSSREYRRLYENLAEA